MSQTPELLQGAIVNDYRDILDSLPASHASPKQKANTGKGCSVPKVCPKANTGKGCSVPKVCPKANTGKGCSVPKICPKAGMQALPAVPGWSSPPAPPSV